MQRTWKIKDNNIVPSPQLIAAAGDLPILAKLLAIRGITDAAQAHAFLNLDAYQPTSGTAFEDMPKAMARITQAIAQEEPILVFGDFDVDGVTSASILMDCFKTLGAKVSYHIPDRKTEGHGLNSTALIRLVSARRIKLVITTDTGITNFNEVSLLNGLGVDTIITDHHELPENLPAAYAILNPKLLVPNSPLAHLSGAGVAFKLAECLLQDQNHPQHTIDKLLDLTAIGTVVDMVPLLMENRYLVWRGLEVMQTWKRPGLTALLEEANVPLDAPITARTFGFVLGPRLNAVGRLANGAGAVDLLTGTDPDEIRKLAAQIEQHNRKRKELVDQAVLQAESYLMSTGELTDQKAIILANASWHTGIVGLVATRLVEKYNRPCFIGMVDDEADEIRYSARSIPDFNMHANLRDLEDLFIRWGGHSGAAGFSIKKSNLQNLKSRLFTLCKERIEDSQMRPVVHIDMMLSTSQISTHLVDILEKMAPFGQSNPAPLFGLDKTPIAAHRCIGENNRHLKLILHTDKAKEHIEAMCWNAGGEASRIQPGATYRFAFSAEMNAYNGQDKLQLILHDFQNEAVTVLPAQNAGSELLTKTPATLTSVSRSTVPTQSLETETHASASNPQDHLDTLGQNAGIRDTLQWIDHRQRDELETFLSQVILSPVTPTDKNQVVRIFCEGSQVQFPIPLDEALFCGRNGASAVLTNQEMILWDLPPDMASFIQLLRTQKPLRIHLMGGKYKKIPLYRPAKTFLSGLRNLLSQQWKENKHQPTLLSIAKLASLAATTPAVVLSGLTVLAQLNIATLEMQSAETLHLTALCDAGALEQDLSKLPAYIQFQNALQAVHQFREWIMQAPLPVLRFSVALALAEPIPVSPFQRLNSEELTRVTVPQS